jgi:hypothetical protein
VFGFWLFFLGLSTSENEKLTEVRKKLKEQPTEFIDVAFDTELAAPAGPRDQPHDPRRRRHRRSVPDVLR